MSTKANTMFTIHAERQFSNLRPNQNLEEKSTQNEGSVQTFPLDTSWSSWDRFSCIVLLGEPGSGKTKEFSHQFNSQQNSFFSRWNIWFDGDDIFETLEIGRAHV